LRRAPFGALRGVVERGCAAFVVFENAGIQTDHKTPQQQKSPADGEAFSISTL
jgi:hypothetical protein